MENLAKDLTIAQIWAAASSVILVIVVMAKHFKAVADAWPSIVKTWRYFQNRWFREEIFRKDLMAKMDSMRILQHKQAESIENIQKEMMYNGGSSLRDSVKRIEDKVEVLAEGIEYNRQVREITDKCSDTMYFKIYPDGACYFINDAFLRNFGWQESDVLEFGFENLVHPDDRNEMQLKWQKAIDTKTSFKDVQRIRDVHGEYHNCTVTAHPVVIKGQLKKFKGIIDFNDGPL
jgi:PAS domain S-box-containing protein